MIFSIDEDAGGYIQGWLLPDDPKARPRIRVSVDGEAPVEIAAAVLRPPLKSQGLHDTGHCGFIVDDLAAPGLSSAQEVEIHDADTGILIYRRSPAEGRIESLFLRLETRLGGSGELDAALWPHFQMAYGRIEGLDQKTLMSVLGIRFSQSIYASGRALYRSVDALAPDRGFKVGILVDDPYVALAERLAVMKRAAVSDSKSVNAKLGRGFVEVAGAFGGVDLSSPRAVEASLKGLPAEAIHHIQNPLARQLTAGAAREDLDPLAPAAALQALAGMDVVGLRSDIGGFMETTQALLGAPELPLPETGRFEADLGSIADSLRGIRAVEDLLAADLAVYGGLCAAIGEARDAGPPAAISHSGARNNYANGQKA